MIRCLVQDLVRATRGVLLWGSPKQAFESISTDSRNLKSGDVFLALRGPNFDGNTFAPTALKEGALGIVVSKDPQIENPPEGTFGVLVSDTLQAFGDFASWYRTTLNPRVVALGGSCGKTTTKDMCSTLLQGTFQVLATQGNFNNLIGVPKTLLRLTPENTLAVVELGMNQTGELRRLMEIVKPEVAILTNIVEAHIGQFGSLAKLIAAKAEMIEGLGENGLLVANADCPHSMRAVEQVGRPLQIMTFGLNTPADVMCEEIVRLDPLGYRVHVTARGEQVWIDLRLFGRFQVYNALAAVAVGLAMGVDLETAAARLTDFRPASLRTEIEDFNGVRLVKDCYNAAPSATVEALNSLRDLTRPEGGRMMVLLGDMLELGNYEELYHRVVGEKVIDLPLDLIVTVGERARTIHEVVSEAGLPCRHCETPREAGQYLGDTMRANDTLFVKGSRLMKLELAIDALKERMTVGAAAPRVSPPASPPVA